MRYNRDHLRMESDKNIIDILRDMPGIYKIFASNKKIGRVISVDETGLLYIGMAKASNGLLKRIRDFYDSASNINKNGSPPSTHYGGKYYQLYLKKYLGDATERLNFEYEISTSDQDAGAREKVLLNEYINKYGELPPINHQLPK